VLAVAFLHLGYHRAQFSDRVRERLYQRFLDDPVGASVAHPLAAVRVHHVRDGDEYLYLCWADLMLGRPADRDYLLEQSDARISLLPSSAAPHLLPYRDFVFQYPPLAVVPVVLPALITTDPVLYPYAFGTLAGIAALAIAVAGWSIRAHLAEAMSAGRYLWLSAAALFLVGVTLETRLDVFAAAAVAAALWAAMVDRQVLAGLLLGAGAAIKVYPGLLFFAFVAFLVAQGDHRKIVASSGAFLSAVLLCCVPAALLSWGGLLQALGLHSARELQIESVAATVVAWARLAAGSPLETVRAFGAREIVSASSHALASVCRLLVVLMVLIGALLPWLGLRKGQSDAKALLIDAVAMTIAGIWIASPVLSPQYLVWGLPAFLFVSSPAARLLYLLALALTRIVYPACYPFISHLSLPGLALVSVRNCILIAAWAALVKTHLIPRRGGRRTWRESGSRAALPADRA
jgi:hypothetical protein